MLVAVSVGLVLVIIGTVAHACDIGCQCVNGLGGIKATNDPFCFRYVMGRKNARIIYDDTALDGGTIAEDTPTLDYKELMTCTTRCPQNQYPAEIATEGMEAMAGALITFGSVMMLQPEMCIANNPSFPRVRAAGSRTRMFLENSMSCFLILAILCLLEPVSLAVSTESGWTDCEYSPNGKYIAAWRSHQVKPRLSDLCVWSLVSTGTALPEVRLESQPKFEYEVHGACFTSDDTLAVLAGYPMSSRRAKPQEPVLAWPTVFLRLPELVETRRWESLDRTSHQSNSLLRQSSDGKMLFHSVGTGGVSRVRILDAETGLELGAIKAQRNENFTAGIFVTSDRQSTRVLVGGLKQHYLWHVDQTGTAVRIATATHPALLSCLALAPRGTEVSVGLYPPGDPRKGGVAYEPKAALLLWNSETQKSRYLTTNERFITASAFSSDSKILATGSVDSIVALWDVKTGTRICKLTCSGQIRSLRFSPDAQFLLVLAAAGLSGKVEGAALRLYKVDDLRKVQDSK